MEKQYTVIILTVFDQFESDFIARYSKGPALITCCDASSVSTIKTSWR